MTRKPSPSALHRMHRATLGLLVVAVAVKAAGFAEKQAIAYYLGADERVDAFFVALSVPTVLFLLAREMIEPAFLPLFVEHIDGGRQDRAWALFRRVATHVALLSLVVALVVATSSRSLVRWLAPGLPPEAGDLAATLLRWMMPASTLLALSALSWAALNAQRRFTTPASGDLWMRIAPVLMLYAFTSLDVYALALGTVLGAACRLGTHLVCLRSEPWSRIDGALPREDLQRVGRLMVPLAIGVVFAQLGELADNHFASIIGPGAVSARTYAKKIADLPLLLGAYTVSVVLFPYLSALHNEERRDELARLLALSMRALGLAFGLLAAVTVALPEAIVSLALERGAFDAQARLFAAGPLRWYGLGMIVFALEAVLVPFYFAIRDTRTPVVLGIAGVAVHVAACWALVGPFGAGGVAMAATLAKTCKLLALLLHLRWYRPDLHPPALLASTARILAAAATASAVCVAMERRWPIQFGDPLSLALQLGLMTGLATIAYVLVVLCVPSPERELLARAYAGIRSRERRWLG